MEGFPGEKLTEGMDGLADDLNDYYDMGARFAKWRAVIKIGANTPTAANIKANAYLLARYAILCQEAGLVPIVEPEVLMDGDHTISRCAEVTSEVLHAVFNALYEQKVRFEYLILKPNMILPGKACPEQPDDESVARCSILCYLRCVPAAVPGIAFLSGGQPAELATARLSEMENANHGKLPWALTFSFSRATQQPALEYWRGKDTHVPDAQKLLVRRAALNSAARLGCYKPEMEAMNNGGPCS
jgi:fructose-bisphosphate aldolase class I